MEKELKQEQLLRTDLIAAIFLISPYIQFVGLLSGGGVTTAKYVVGFNKSQNDENSEITELVIEPVIDESNDHHE